MGLFFVEALLQFVASDAYYIPQPLLYSSKSYLYVMVSFVLEAFLIYYFYYYIFSSTSTTIVLARSFASFLSNIIYIIITLLLSLL